MHTHHTYKRFLVQQAGLVLLAGMYTTGLQAQTCSPVVPQASINKNYIISYTARDSNITNPLLTTLTNCAMLRTVQYFDGLGRPLQTVQIKGSADGTKDVITPVQYDQYGRQAKNFLPYIAPTGAPGSYRANALNTGGNYATSGQKTFYNQTGQNYVNIPTPYAATVFEASPRSRVLEQGAPGDAWQPQTARAQTSGRTVAVEYATNNILALTDTANTKFVALYKATTAATQVITLSRAVGTPGRYDANQLSVTISKDENWMSGKGGTTEEYKDKEGHVVLKRLFNWLPAPLNKLEILSTYYVYDDRGNLAFVLPPKANADNVTSISQTVLDELCYQYLYDDRKRLTQKKLPGKDWDFFLYNKLDQIVGTQDGVQRGKAPQEWTVTRYDDMGRVVLTGIYIHPSSIGGTSYRSALQNNLVDTQTTLWETPTGTAANYGYTKATFPATITTTLSVNYYDDYSFAGTNPYPFAGASSLTKDKPTGGLVNVLGTTNMLMSVIYYDDQGRNIKTVSQHYLNGVVDVNNYDEVRTAYSFTGEAKTLIRKHFTAASGSTPALVAINRYTYDQVGRKIDSYQRTGAATSPEVLVSRNEYNDIGQLYHKKLHSENLGSSFLQDIAYSYNERGWLKKINEPAMAQPADNSKLFSMELKYADGTYKQFNGNITNQLFVNTGSTTEPLQTFTYQYDQLNRLKSGISTGATLPSNNMAETAIAYDELGNIKSLTRDAATPYSYSYIMNGTVETSRLKSVSGITTGDYAYDVNGNMKTDARNGATLQYNMLNLLASVTKTGVNLSYIYDAGGQKLRKVSNVTGTTDYIGGIVYNTISSVYRIDFVQTEEGRAINNNDGTYRYQYDLKDQLGNVRLTFQKSSTTGKADRVQSDNYYAFGMRKSINPTVIQNKYLYNGKEIQDETGDYDYGARQYDPVIARWVAIDPLAEKSRKWSPYNYVYNNPLNFTDPDGMSPASESEESDRSRQEKELEQKEAEDNAQDAQLRSDAMAANGGFGAKSDLTNKSFSSMQLDESDNSESEDVNSDQAGGGPPSYTPPPKSLPGFPDAQRVSPKGPVKRPRWKLPNGDLLEWDGQHRELERYNPQGKHKGVWNEEGKQIKDKVKGRKITVINEAPKPHLDPSTVRMGIKTVGTGVAIYIGIKLIELAITVATGGGAAPILLL
jgi:RHS repeat-associated protein